MLTPGVGKRFQNIINIDSTCFNRIEREGGWEGGRGAISASLFNRIEHRLKQMFKPFAGTLSRLVTKSIK